MSWKRLALTFSTLAALVISGAALTNHRADAREDAAEAAYPPDGQFVDIDGTRMHVLVEGDGPDLVLIHGSSGSLRDFTFSLLPELTDSYRVFAVDRPGLGWSGFPKGGETLSVQADLIRRAVAKLGAKKPLVLGQSYGGAVALSWAVTAPDDLSGLIMVSAPSHPWPTGLSTFYKVTSNPFGRALAVPALTAFVPAAKVTKEVNAVFTPDTAPDGYADHFGPAMTLRRSSLRANAMQRRVLKDEVVAMMPAYPAINVPVEVIHGTADTTVSPKLHAEQMVRDIPTARYTPLDGVGHMPHHTAVPDVVAAIDRAAQRAGLR